MAMAALGGFEDAKGPLTQWQVLPDTTWNAVFDRVQ
jgi:hypothetical protein